MCSCGGSCLHEDAIPGLHASLSVLGKLACMTSMYCSYGRDRVNRCGRNAYSLYCTVVDPDPAPR